MPDDVGIHSEQTVTESLQKGDEGDDLMRPSRNRDTPCSIESRRVVINPPKESGGNLPEPMKTPVSRHPFHYQDRLVEFESSLSRHPAIQFPVSGLATSQTRTQALKKHTR